MGITLAAFYKYILFNIPFRSIHQYYPIVSCSCSDCAEDGNNAPEQVNRHYTNSTILPKMTISKSNDDYSPKIFLKVYLLTENKTELTLMYRYLDTNSVEVIPVHGYSVKNVHH